MIDLATFWAGYVAGIATVIAATMLALWIRVRRRTDSRRFDGRP